MGLGVRAVPVPPANGLPRHISMSTAIKFYATLLLCQRKVHIGILVTVHKVRCAIFLSIFPTHESGEVALLFSPWVELSDSHLCALVLFRAS